MGRQVQPDGAGELAVERTRTLPAPAALVWAVAGDTNRWDRVVGAGPTNYQPQSVPGEPGVQQVGHGQLAGMPASWVERGEWIEGEHLHGERHYLSGPLRLAGFRIDVSGEGDHATIALRAYVVPSMVLPVALEQAMLRNLEQSADRYLDGLANLFSGIELPASEAGESAAAYARRALASVPAHDVVDESSPVHEDDLAFCQRKLETTNIDPRHRDLLVEMVRTRSDIQLEQMRPFELARTWGLRRRALLRSFLHAATTGLLDLRWQLNCPRCQVAASAAPRLDAIGHRAHCDACDIDFDLDLAANVEAVFRVNPAVREVPERIYCTSSPWFRPHVFAVFDLAAGETRAVELSLPADGFTARLLRGPAARITAAAADCRVTVHDDHLDVETGSALAGDRRARVELRNPGSRPAILMLERPGADANATRGTDILSMPEFLDLFGTEAPAAGEELTIGSVAVLFSDLSRTTELYRTLGDARAFALIQEHFRAMGEIIADAGGAILKTMGDAVMASFAAPAGAIVAALEMIDTTRRTHAANDLRLKVGVHVGPCVMVRANHRPDLFGTTVNLAARLQEQAGPDQLVVLPELLEHAEIARVIAARKLVPIPARAALKGMGEPHDIVLFTL